MKINYTTLSADNEELQSYFDKAIETVKPKWLGKEHAMWINGESVYSDEKLDDFSPIDTNMKLGTFQKGTADQANDAIDAAKAAKVIWRQTDWKERVAKIRAVAQTMSDRLFEISTVLVMEVGKSRMEALAETQETIDLLKYYADDMDKNTGYIKELGKLNPDDPKEQNFSYLQPYGVWVVISPFNFPLALASAPIAAALVTGNTVVFKGSSDTPFVSQAITDVFTSADLPKGVFNHVMGPGRTAGQALLDNPNVNGWTFTGSYDLGMKVLRNATNGSYPRPTIIEMGGKNPAIISSTADLDKAVSGVYRAAFGMNGQKCSACSRVYVHKDVYDAFKEKLIAVTAALKIGDPLERSTFMGPIIHKTALGEYKEFTEMAGKDGRLVYGGNILTEGDFVNGFYCEPAIVEGLPEDHLLVKKELFLPILHIAKVDSNEEAMKFANDTDYGLTAGFFGEEIEWFFDNIEAGTTYANREGGATTGAWPGVQVFGGWKGSGASGKGIGGFYTLPLYMHEQSRTIIG
ncbi:MAG: 1-pyrroline-5-carboxylate dehydrogenase [Anaerolineaceae bacterium 4572_78]|nr:MAG: 1-pyrroline-5-carboxylate dehydrogenase [Anaerolineaceae bacterium 4572_78]